MHSEIRKKTKQLNVFTGPPQGALFFILNYDCHGKLSDDRNDVCIRRDEQ